MKYSFAILLLALYSCSSERETIHAEKKEMVEAVYSSIVLEPDNAYKVNSSITGYIETVNVSEGDAVKKGDVLFVISNQPVKLNQENAALNYELLDDSYKGEANVLEEMNLELKSAKLKMKNDSINYLRFKNLYDKNACTKFDFDNAALAYEISKNNCTTLSSRIKRKEKELKNQLNQLKNTLSVSALRTDDYYIKSNIDGKVFQVFKERGEYASMQEPLAIVGDKSNFKLKMLIDEVDISNVQLGQKVLVTLEAYKSKVFEAKITKISPKMDERTQTFEVEAFFVNAPDHLYMGLTGEGNIVIREKKSALVIPREYLMPGNKVETENGIVKVKTGLSNWSYVEITAGITESTVLLKPE